MKIQTRTAGGPYYVHFTGPGGQRLRLSTGTTDEAEAQLKALELMREHLVDALPEGAEKVAAQLETLGGLLQQAWHHRWSKLRGTGQRRALVAKISREIGHWPLGAVTYARVENWLDNMTTGKHPPRPLANATKNRHVSVIHTAFSEASKRNPLIVPPKLPHYAENNVRERYLTAGEERALLDYFAENVAAGDVPGQYMRNLTVVLLDTGMRTGEALEQMTAASVLQRPDGSFAVHLTHGSTKSGKGRMVPLTARAKEAVDAMLASPLHGTWTSQQTGQRFKRITTRLGFPEVTLHTLRHTCASRLVQRGVDLYVVMTWLGHSSMVITQRYAHLAPDTLTAALAALEDVPSGPVIYPQAEAHPPLSGTLSKPKLFAVK